MRPWAVDIGDGCTLYFLYELEAVRYAEKLEKNNGEFWTIEGRIFA